MNNMLASEIGKELFEERAAIMEYEYGLSRKEAEKLAEEWTRRKLIAAGLYKPEQIELF